MTRNLPGLAVPPLGDAVPPLGDAVPPLGDAVPPLGTRPLSGEPRRRGGRIACQVGADAHSAGETKLGPLGAAPGELELTILMPCLNEAETVATCVRKARSFLATSGVAGEVLVADNGSTDGSAELAVQAGARVVSVAVKGYGTALLGGIQSARGRYVIMGDADDSYDFAGLAPFLDAAARGARPGDGQPVPRRDRAGRHARAAPLPRQPGAQLRWAGCSSAATSATSTAACAASGGTALTAGLKAHAAWNSPARWSSRPPSPGEDREVPTTLSPDGRSRRRT